jgi:hypothetical protein
LSQRRRNNVQRNAEGHDLTGQDREWVPADQHKEYEDEEEEEEHGSVQDSAVNGETRGRQETVAA